MINMAFMPLYMWEMWDVTPVTHERTDTRTVESRAVFSLNWIRNTQQIFSQILVAMLTLFISLWQETFWNPKSSWILLLPNYQETGLSRSLTSSLPDAKQGVFQFYIPMMFQDFQLFPYNSSFTVAWCDQASSLLNAWMDSSLMKCGAELEIEKVFTIFTIFNKGRISRCAQIFFYGWNSNRVLFEVFSTAKSNSVLFWTTSNSLTTCAHTQNKFSIFCGIFQAILFIKAYYYGTRFD